MLRRVTTTVPLNAIFYPPRGARSVDTIQQALAASGDTTRSMIIVAHGLLGSARNWNSTAMKLSKELHNIECRKDVLCKNTIIAAVDLRNHGSSPHSDEHTLPAMAADLDHFVEDMVDQSGGRIERLAIVGHSMGGAALVHTLSSLSHRPTRPKFPALTEVLRAAVIVDICPDCRPTAALQSVNRIFHAMATVPMYDESVPAEALAFGKVDEQLKKGGISEHGLRQFVLTNYEGRNSHHPDRPVWRCNFPVLNRVVTNNELFVSPLKHDPTEKDSEGDKIEHPTLFVFGANSPYNNREARERIPRYFSRVEQVELEKAGHYVHVERQDEFVKATADWFRELRC